MFVTSNTGSGRRRGRDARGVDAPAWLAASTHDCCIRWMCYRRRIILCDYGCNIARVLGGDNLPTLMGDNWLWCRGYCFMEAEGGEAMGGEVRVAAAVRWPGGGYFRPLGGTVRNWYSSRALKWYGSRRDLWYRSRSWPSLPFASR